MHPLSRLALDRRTRTVLRRRYRAGTRAAAWSLGLGASLSLAKIAVGLAGGSRAAVADGVESACDTVNSMILLGALVVAIRPPDADHPYGHDRAESISAVLLAAVLTFAGVSTGVGVLLGDWRAPRTPELYTLWPILAALPLKALMAAWKSRLAEQADSTSLRSEGFNDAADVLSGTVAAAGIILARAGGGAFLLADRIAAIAVSALIVAGGLRLLRGSLSELMDEAPPPDLLRRIRRLAGATPGVARIDKVLGRRSGTGYFLDLHVEVEPRLPLARAHDIGHRVKQRLLEALPGVRDVLTHIEPAGMARRHRAGRLTRP